MDTNETFKFYGNYDVSNFKKIIIDNNLDWAEFTIRQKSCYDMINTQTIPIVFDSEIFTTNFCKKIVHYNSARNTIGVIVTKNYNFFVIFYCFIYSFN